MIRYAVIPKSDAPDPLPDAPVRWEFTVGDVVYIGLEWGNDEENQPVLGEEWELFSNNNEFNEWLIDNE